MNTHSQTPHSLLVGLAMLNQDWDRAGRSFLDNFLPFVGDCLREAGREGMTDLQLRACIHDRYGIDVPIGVLNTLLRRLRREGLATRTDKVNHPTDELVQREPLAPERSSVQRRITALVEKLRTFALAAGQDWSIEEAEQALRLYVEEWHRALAILAAEYRGDSCQPRLVNDAATDYVVANFFLEIQDQDPVAFEWVLDVIKASMITAGLYLDLGRLSQTFSDQTTAYLDTPNILDLLVGDEDSRAAAEELVELCREMNVQLACFDHTRDEVRHVLEGTARSMRLARGPDGARPSSHGLEERCSASDLEKVSQELADRLGEYGIAVKRKPLWNGNSTTDELRLDEVLQEVVGYAKGATRRRDVESIVAVHQIRRGEQPTRMEDGRAFLITSNRDLARASGRHFGTDALPASVPVVLTHHDFATLLWLKSPTERPDLPWKQLLADCRAAVRPSESLWAQYLDEVDRLAEQGAIGADTYLLARHSNEARRALMERTHGDKGRVTSTTVTEALEEARAAVAQPVVDAAVIRMRREAEREAEAELARMREDVTERADRSYADALRTGERQGQERAVAKAARVIASIVGGFVAFFAFVAFILLSVVDAFEWPGWGRFVAALLLLAVGVPFTWATAMGGSIRDLVAHWVEPRLRARLHAEVASEEPEEN